MRKILLTITLLAAAARAMAGTFTAKTYIEAALAASPSMKSAEESFRQAENGYKTSLLDAALPSLTLTLGETFYDDQDTRLRASKTDVTSSLSASWNLYDSASSPARRIKTARLDFESSKLVLLKAKQDEALKAMARFYALYSAQQLTVIAKANLASRERQYKDTNEQFNSGTRSRIEVTQSEGDKLRSELSVAQAEAAEVKALMAFNELINADPEAAQQVSVSTEAPVIKLPMPREDVELALRDNLAIRIQRLSLEKVRLTYRTSVNSALPRLSLDASWTRTGLGVLGIPSGAGQGNPSYALGASLRFPFGFLGAQNYLRTRTAASQLTSSELNLENSVRAMKTAVLTSQKDIELQVKSRQLLEFQVKAQRDTTDNLLNEYSLGGASFLQLDSSQAKMLDAGNSLVGAVNDLDLALFNYRALLGERIWE
ncbi:MAG: TolC family protein [Elusimicrobia bacterium]|nr:TolC family protein [Elusimicrobiota bacterium]